MALENTKPEIRFTGNRQNIPLANTSRTIKSEINTSDEYSYIKKKWNRFTEIKKIDSRTNPDTTTVNCIL